MPAGDPGSNHVNTKSTETFYRELFRIRRVEEEIARVYPTDKIQSPVHLSIGQEAVAVGVCQALERKDVAFGTYRSHAFYLAKGGDLKKMVAELYGKATGCAKGKGGSMHIVDTAAGVMGTSAVVATGIPQAVGYAYMFRVRNEPQVSVCFFGDGAAEEGAFHESLNLAALKRLPVLFVCENNRYAIHTHQRDRQAFSGITEFVRGYGIPAERLEEPNVFAIHKAAALAVEAMRHGGGPVFIECLTYRFREHVGPSEDYHHGYRDAAEAKPWIERDEVMRLAGMISPAEREKIERDVVAEIADAFAFAEASPFPEPEELLTDVYAG